MELEHVLVVGAGHLDEAAYALMETGLGDSKYASCPLLRQYVAAGRLGRKSGRGFYEYA